MIDKRFQRQEWLFSDEAMQKLSQSSVIVFGVGGVGGQVCEVLARSGVGKIALVDFDKVSITNINRQIIALGSTLNQLKVEVMKQRLLDIHPDMRIETFPICYDEQTKNQICLENYDYIVDAIDMVSSKVLLICEAKKANIPIISAMGAGNKIHPELFTVGKLNQTSICPLARIMRYQLKKHNITDLKVVYSKELPIKYDNEKPGSYIVATATMGILLADALIKDLMQF